MTKININKVLDELKDKIDEYDIKPLYLKTVRNMFYSQHDIYVDEKNIIVCEDIKTSLDDLKERHIATYESLNNARLFYRFKDVRYTLKMVEHIVNDNIILHRYGYINNNDLIWFISGVLKRSFDKGYQESDVILKTNNLLSDNPKFKIHLDKSIILESFMNGKITISGLSQEQKDNILYGYDLVKKYQHSKL